jgi:FkbM family methyltransferase
MRKILSVIARRLVQMRFHNILPGFLKRLYWRMVFSGHERIEFQVYGSAMLLSPDERLLSLYMYEPAMVKLLINLLRDGMTFCDVGANIGIFTLLAARLVAPHGRVIAFEPEPKNAAILKKNIAINQYNNIDVIEKAVSETPGTCEFHLSDFSGCHSLFPGNLKPQGQTLLVETVRLDSIPGMDRVDVMKIDVEGAELFVLRSLGEIRPATIILEYNAERARAAGVWGRAFLDAIRKIGYKDIRNLDALDAGLETVEKDDRVSLNLLLRR